VIKSIDAIIAEIDKKLTEQINRSCTTPTSRSWKGPGAVCITWSTTPRPTRQLKIRVMNISKKDLGKTLKRYKGTNWDQSPLFKKFYEAEYGQFGGEPFGCIVGDYHFDHTRPDVEMLGEIAKIAPPAHCPFISGAVA
jgi:type VI secretion system protein ImpC